MNDVILYIDRDKVDELLNNKWNILLNLIEKALKSFSDGKVVQPVRTVLPIDKHNGRLLAMPAYDENADCLATKLVTVYPDNKRKGLPNIQATILLHDALNGKLKAIMDGEVITNMRTAVASMVATKYLASESSKCVSILGAGEQARSHYLAMKSIFDIQQVYVWNVSKESGEKLVKEISEDGTKCKFCSTVEEAVREADVINVVTMATKPILMKTWVKDGVHINAVGAPFPTWQELEPDLMLSSVVYVDSKKGAIVESGDIILSGAKIYAEIGEVVSGKREGFRNKTTVFKSLGMAVEDVVTADLVYKLFIGEF